MKSLEHRLWFLLFMMIGNGLVALLLLFYGTQHLFVLWSVPLRYLVLCPSIIAAYSFAGIVAIVSIVTPAHSDAYVTSIKKKLISPTWLLWSVARAMGSVILLVITDILWIIVTVYNSYKSGVVRTDLFADQFGMLLGVVNLMLVVKIFLIYVYGPSDSKWPIVMTDGFTSLAIAIVLASVMIVAPFNGMMAYPVELLLKLTSGAFFFLQSTDAAARFTRAFEYRHAEKMLREESAKISNEYEQETIF